MAGSAKRHPRCRKRRLKLLKHAESSRVKNYSEGNAHRFRNRQQEEEVASEWWMKDKHGPRAGG